MTTEPTFSFPYEPYEIQKVFMKELYFTLQNSKFGIFESPTGTGKSLSICCATLQWLKDNYEQKVLDLETRITELKITNPRTESTDDWLVEEYEKIKHNQELLQLQSQLENMKLREQKYVEMKQRVERQKRDPNIKNVHKQYRDKHGTQTDTLLEEESKDEQYHDQDLILEDVQQNDEDEESNNEEEMVQNQDKETKVIIASRTHSQLSQLVGEIRKTVFKESVRVVTLASRQHYCINSDVTKLHNSNLINERCLELQKSRSKATAKAEDGKVVKKSRNNSCGSCPYYKQSNITAVKERLLVELMDMEDIVSCGKQLKGCPYYATRKAVEDAQVVLVSHAGLVTPGCADSVGVCVSDAVVVVDEAHGLGGALTVAHGHTLTHTHLHAALGALGAYVARLGPTLSSHNLLHVNQILYVVKRLTEMVKPHPKEDGEDTKIYKVQDFLAEAEIDHINLRPLVDFCKKSRLAPKLNGFAMRYKPEDLDNNQKTTVSKKNNLENFLSTISKKKGIQSEEKLVDENKENDSSQCTSVSVGGAMYALIGILEAVTGGEGTGRVVLHGEGRVNYLLLDPGVHFSQLVRDCRAVVLAGGTMSPVAEFRALLSGPAPAPAPPREVVEVAVDHVVPPDHLLALGVSTGPTHRPLTLTHRTRADPHMLDEVCAVLRNVCVLVLGGVVCFTPSYSYLDTLHTHLREHAHLTHICKRKSVFTEPKDAKDVDQVLSKFAEAVNNKSDGKTGALLLSVVGGKLSEGLNFSDDLGRCVLVVGVPYPNVRSPELCEKVRHLDCLAPGTGAQLLENICMKAVNQSIGRAVRHIADYAAVLLVDQRYSRPHTIQGLPHFVQKSFIPNCNFGSAMRHMAQFFARHKKTTDNNI